MSRLSYPKKIALISVFFLLPLIVVSVLLSKELNLKIEVTEQEQQGLRYIQVVRQLYQHLPEHRGMMNGYLNGSVEFKEKILLKRQLITADIAAIDVVDARFGAEFVTQQHWQSIKQDWQALERRALSGEAADIFAAHTALIKKVYALLGKVSNGSGLALDSYINTYAVVDALVYRLPLIGESLGQLRGMAMGAVVVSEISLLQRVQLGLIMGELSSSYSAVKEDIDISLRENEGWKNNYGPSLLATEQQLIQFNAMITKGVLETELITLDADTIFNEGSKTIASVYRLYDDFFLGLDGLFVARQAELTAVRNTVMGLIVITSLVVLYLLVGFYLAIINTIRTLDDSMRRVAAGDLTVNVESGSQDELDNIATSLNTMVGQMRGLMRQLGEHSSLLASASTELSATTEGSKNTALAQQQQADQIATAMSEMVESINDASSNATMASADASDADREANEGGAVIRKTIVSIEGLAEEVNVAAAEVAKLEQNSIDIGSVLDVIRSIADQTNLLALNAAIEAARAGEHGRGFAVVADEVRTLAGRTQESTEQIQEMVERLQNNTKKSVMVMEANKLNAGKVAGDAANASESIDIIVTKVAQIMGKTNQVASATEGQVLVAKQIDSRVDEVSDGAHSSVAAAGEIALASEELARLAIELQGVVAHFKT
ncbi:MAG: methyl-accepting chemotaxis protein [Cycloclasticus sp.]